MLGEMLNFVSDWLNVDDQDIQSEMLWPFGRTTIGRGSLCARQLFLQRVGLIAVSSTIQF